MKIIKFNKNHIPALKIIFESAGKSKFPNVTSPLFIVRGTMIDDDGKIIGAGFIKLTAEALICVEPSLTIYKKATIITKLYEVGRISALKKGLDELYAYVRDTPSFVTFLMKKLNFERLDVVTLFTRLK